MPQTKPKAKPAASGKKKYRVLIPYIKFIDSDGIEQTVLEGETTDAVPSVSVGWMINDEWIEEIHGKKD